MLLCCYAAMLLCANYKSYFVPKNVVAVRKRFTRPKKSGLRPGYLKKKQKKKRSCEIEEFVEKEFIAYHVGRQYSTRAVSWYDVQYIYNSDFVFGNFHSEKKTANMSPTYSSIIQIRFC